MKLSDLIDFNPKRPLEKGAITPFIEMADLPEGERDVSGIGNRVFNGGGSKFRNGDTLFARITPCLENGKTAKVSGLPSNAVGHGSTEFIVMAAKDPSVDEEFVYYVARHPEFRAYARGRMEGTSGRQRVSWQAIADYAIPDFSSFERKRIGTVLSSMDNLIAANRQINETLEAMARALFKAWFVDFEPVRAKLEGRWQRGQSLPGLPAHLYDLFPDRLVESEFGEIPEGWQTLPVYDIATYVNGAAFKAFQPNDEGRGLPIIKIAELKTGVTAQTKFSDVAMPEKYRLRTGDILFSWSGNPDTSIDTFIWAHGDAWLNQHIFRVDVHSSGERAFVLATLKYLRPVFAEIARNKQTTGLGHVTVGDMKRLLVVKPEGQVLAAWDRVVAPIFAAAFRNEADSISLGRLRDTLLPKLISGELRVQDAEGFLEERGLNG